MVEIYNLLRETNGFMYLFRIIVSVAVLIILFKFVMIFFKRKLLSKAKTKEQISNIKILSRIINLGFIAFLVIFGFLSYLRSWTGIGVAIGLITAALGFALQKPITGIAAWLMVVIKRPFNVGDRITLGKFKGDVYDISLTHLYLDEVGGLVDSEQRSGRNIMIPNHLLFEEAIINHTLRDDYVLNEIEFFITYSTNLNKALKVATNCVKKHLDKSLENNDGPQTILKFLENKILVKISYYIHIKEMQKVKEDILKEIFNNFGKERDLSFSD